MSCNNSDTICFNRRHDGCTDPTTEFPASAVLNTMKGRAAKPTSMSLSFHANDSTTWFSLHLRVGGEMNSDITQDLATVARARVASSQNTSNQSGSKSVRGQGVCYAGADASEVCSTPSDAKATCTRRHRHHTRILCRPHCFFTIEMIDKTSFCKLSS